MATKPVRARKPETGLELKYHLWLGTVDAVAGILQSVIRYGALALVAYFLYRTVNVLAGKETFADIGIQVLGNLRLSETLGWTFGAGGVLYGWKQRKLRHDKTEYLQERIRKLETQHDPNRTSSRLTPRGTTNPADKRE